MATFVVVGHLPAAARQEHDRGADSRAGLAADSRVGKAVLDPAPPGELQTAPWETMRERPADGCAVATSHTARQTALNSRYRAIFDEISRIGGSLSGVDPSLAIRRPASAPVTEEFPAPAPAEDWDAARPSLDHPWDGAQACAPQAGPNEDASAAAETLNLLRRTILARTVRPTTLPAAPGAGSRPIALSEAALAALTCAREGIVEREPAAAAQSLRRAVDILGDLEAELDPDPADQLASGLARIYSYCRRRVMEVHLHRDPAGLAEAAGLLASLREAWRLAQDQPRSIGP